MTREEEIENLQEVVAILNDPNGPEDDWHGKRYGYDDAVRLRRIILAWRLMMEECAATGPDIRRIKLTPQDRSTLEEYMKALRVSTQPNGMSRVLYDRPENKSWDECAYQFIRLLSNSLNARLGGPCPGVANGKLCGQWFAGKKSGGEYCSRTCAGTATKARERRRKQAARIEVAQRAIASYASRPKRFLDLDWKEYVSQAEPKTSKRFLTESVRRGELVEPKAGPGVA